MKNENRDLTPELVEPWLKTSPILLANWTVIGNEQEKSALFQLSLVMASKSSTRVRVVESPWCSKMAIGLGTPGPG